MTIKEFKDKVYEEYKTQIDLISEVSKETRPEGEWQADIGVATDMFINYVENTEKSVFVKVPEAKARIAELRAQISE